MANGRPQNAMFERKLNEIYIQNLIIYYISHTSLFHFNTMVGGKRDQHHNVQAAPLGAPSPAE